MLLREYEAQHHCPVSLGLDRFCQHFLGPTCKTFVYEEGDVLRCLADTAMEISRLGEASTHEEGTPNLDSIEFWDAMVQRNIKDIREDLEVNSFLSRSGYSFHYDREPTAVTSLYEQVFIFVAH